MESENNKKENQTKNSVKKSTTKKVDAKKAAKEIENNDVAKEKKVVRKSIKSENTKKDSEKKTTVKKGRTKEVVEGTDLKKVEKKNNVKKQETKKPEVIPLKSDEKKVEVKNEVIEKKTIKEEKEKKIPEKTNAVVEKEKTAFLEKNNLSSEKKKENKKTEVFGLGEVVVLLVITCFVALLIGFSIGKNKKLIVGSDSQNLSEYEEFIHNYQYILNNYYKDINRSDLMKAAINGMLEFLDDPHSVYMDEAESENFNILLTGNYQGIGVQITNNDDNNIEVVSVFKNSPADKAGVLPGDVIVAVNDMNLEGQLPAALSNYIKGGPQTDFLLHIVRDGENVEISIKREDVIIESVLSKVIEQNGKKIGYLGVSIFAANTYEQFKKELENLESQKIDSLIIDLRDNSGGHLSVVSDMLDLFLDKNNIIYQLESKNGTEKIYAKGNVNKTYPIVILSNKNSASASEIMTSALKECLNATIVGTGSYGKGTVQELITLPNGEQYKFTTKKWLTPLGNWINGTGIDADVYIELDSAYYQNPIEENDNQLQRAIDLLK